MFDKKDPVQKIHDALWAFGQKFSKGESVALSAIEAVTGLTKYGEHWHHVLKTFRRRMRLDRGIVMWCVEAGSLRCLTDEEAIRIVFAKRRRRQFRQASSCKRELEAVDVTKLSDADRRCLAIQKEQVRLARKQLRQAANRVQEVNRTQVNPMRRVPQKV